MLSRLELTEIKRYLEQTLGHEIMDKRIEAIGINPPYHGQSKRLIRVGTTYADLEPGAPEEQVIAIFETKLFCVVTKTRGAGTGLPYFFTRDTVFEVREADPQTEET